MLCGWRRMNPVSQRTRGRETASHRRIRLDGACVHDGGEEARERREGLDGEEVGVEKESGWDRVVTIVKIVQGRLDMKS
jgi:hypothetical protein